MDEKGSTEFTIQEVIDRSQQSLRGFYQYFDGKDELLLALFEETVRECIDDVRAVVEAETDPIVRLHAFVIRLHEWCEPPDKPRKRGRHNRRPVSEFMVQLAIGHPDRVKAAMEPVSRLLLDLVARRTSAPAASTSTTPHRAAALVQQTVMYSWFGNRLIQEPAPAPRRRRDLGILPARSERLRTRTG